MLEAEPPHDIFNLAWIAAHDLRTTVGEDCVANSCLFAPTELKRDWSVPDQGSIPFAHHRPLMVAPSPM
jgi:hypothetical protein